MAKALTEARNALADVEAKLAQLKAKREALLLAQDDRALDKLEDELAALRRQVERAADRVSLLEVEARRAEAARQAKEKRGLIERIEKKLEASNEAAAELQNLVELADKAFRKVIALRSECAAAWPWPDQTALALGAQTIRNLLTHELYRVGSHPFVGGADGAIAQVSFPGGRAPDHAMAAQPEAIPPLADTVRQASEYASRLMRGTIIAPTVEQSSDAIGADRQPLELGV
jgi:hypothetical protein